MSAAFVMQSIAGKSKKDVRATGSFQLDTGMLIEFAEAAAGRLDQPDDSSLDWIEAAEYDEPISPRDCYPPDEVTSSLVWLRGLAVAGDKTARDVWKKEWRQKDPFTSEAFLRCISRDLEGLLQFAQEAGARGDKLIGMAVP